MIEDEKQQNGSRVGGQLNELSQKKLIVLVLCMLFQTPVLNFETYMIKSDGFDLSLSFLDSFNQTEPSFSHIFEEFVNH